MAIYTAGELGIEEYHASARLSHSKIKDFERGGPRAFAARHVTRTSTRGATSDAFLFGQNFEDLVCDVPFSHKFVVRPAGMLFTTKEGKAWKAAQEKPIIAQDDLDAMDAMRESLRENGSAMRMIAACRAQTSYTCDLAGTPGMQARPDWDSLDGCIDSGYAPFTLDLKSTVSLGKLVSGRGVADYGYHSQAAVARESMSRNAIPDVRSFLLACEKQAPHRAQVIEITPDWLDVGWQWCERQIEKLRGYYRANEWPRVEREMVQLPPVPGWLANQVCETEEGDDD